MHSLKALKFNTKYLVPSILAVIFVIIGIGYIVANLQASSYQDAVKKWDTYLSNYASSGAPASFSKKIVVGRAETEEERKSQKEECTTTTKRLAWFKDRSESPSLAFNPFGRLSASYRDAANMKDGTASKEKILRETVSALHDYQDLCKFYIAELDIALKETRETQSAKQYLLYEGTDQQQNQSCSISGCLPKDRTLWPKLADIYAGYVTASRSNAKLYKEQCFSAAYKKVCELNSQYFAEDAVLHEKYNQAIRRGSTVYAGFSKPLNRKYDPLIAKAYADVRKDPTPEYNDSESTIQKSLAEQIEKKIESKLHYLRTL